MLLYPALVRRMHVLSVFARCSFLGPITAWVLGSVQLSAMVGNCDTYHLLDMPESQVLFIFYCCTIIIVRKRL